MFLEKQWLKVIVLNVWMYIPQKAHGIIIPMEHILVQDSHICFLWFTQNIDQNVQQINLYLGKLWKIIFPLESTVSVCLKSLKIYIYSLQVIRL